jgi:hypothetical protein
LASIPTDLLFCLSIFEAGKCFLRHKRIGDHANCEP